MTRHPRERNIPAKPAGHFWVPTAMIGGLSLVLAAGLELLGWLPRLNATIAYAVSRDGAQPFHQQLEPWSLWLATTGAAFGVAAVVLGTPGHGRRLLWWLSALAVMAAWAPVLSLAAYFPAVGAPWIATLWSGVCALVYAANHRMAGESSRPHPAIPTAPAAHDPR